VLTTDANGNIAGDGGALFNSFSSARQDIDDNREGVALAIALDAPDFVSGETFGMKMKLATFEGETAFGFSAAGVIAQDVFGQGTRLTVDAGVGVGASEGTVGGGVGMQLTW